MTDIVERLRRDAARFAAMEAAGDQPWVADAAWAAESFCAAADEVERLRAALLKAEMKAEIADIEDVGRLVALGRREGIEAAIVACGGVFTDDKGVWANGFTRGVIEAQASVRALLTEGGR